MSSGEQDENGRGKNSIKHNSITKHNCNIHNCPTGTGEDHSQSRRSAESGNEQPTRLMMMMMLGSGAANPDINLIPLAERGTHPPTTTSSIGLNNGGLWKRYWTTSPSSFHHLLLYRSRGRQILIRNIKIYCTIKLTIPDKSA